MWDGLIIILIMRFKNYPIYHFDHGPIILDFELQHPFRKRPFRFECMWLKHPNCQDMIQKAWSLHTSGSRAAQLRNKLCNLRIEVVEWNKTVFGKVESEIKRTLA